MYRSTLKVLLALVFVISLSSCGYKPSSKFSRNVVGDKVSTSVKISAQNPENTVIIKDAVDQAIVEVFKASLSDRVNSDTHLELSIKPPRYAPIQYNIDGYIIAYRMSVTLNITRYHSGISKDYKAKGSYDFSVVPNAVVTDQERFDAIKLSAYKAINSFIAQVAAEGARSQE